MSTLRYIAHSIQTQLKQNTVTSDISLIHIGYWVGVVANNLRYQNIKKNPTGGYLDVYQDVPVTILNATTNPNQIAGRKYIELPKLIYDLENDEGINFIRYSFQGNRGFEIVPFQHTSPDKAYRLNFSNYEKPSAKNPYWYRIHEYIYFLGVDNTTIKNVELGIYSTLDTRVNLINTDIELDLTEDQLILLHYQVLSLGRFMLSIPKDRISDSTDTNVAIGRQPVVPGQPQEQIVSQQPQEQMTL